MKIIALIAAAIVALFSVAGTTQAQGAELTAAFDPCAPGVLILGQAGRDLICQAPGGQLRLGTYGEDSSLRPKWEGQLLSKQWLAKSVAAGQGWNNATLAVSTPYILRTPTLPECDQPYVQRASRGGIISFECATMRPGRHPITVYVGERGVLSPYRWYIVIDEDLPTRAEYEYAQLPEVETGDQIRIVGQGSSYPEFHFEVINRTDKVVTHVSVRAIFYDNGDYKVGDECGQYGATWRFNTRIGPRSSRWLAITREACLSRATKFGADVLDATFADGGRYRAPRS